MCIDAASRCWCHGLAHSRTALQTSQAMTNQNPTPTNDAPRRPPPLRPGGAQELPATSAQMFACLRTSCVPVSIPPVSIPRAEGGSWCHRPQCLSRWIYGHSALSKELDLPQHILKLQAVAKEEQVPHEFADRSCPLPGVDYPRVFGAGLVVP